jgi:hypothetical protein
MIARLPDCPIARLPLGGFCLKRATCLKIGILPILRLGVLPLAKLHLKHTDSGIKRGTFTLRVRLRFHAAKLLMFNSISQRKQKIYIFNVGISYI